MPNLVSDVLNETGAIPDNQWANVMRISIENKNLLATKGSIYVGTGGTNTVTTGDKDADGNYLTQTIAKTMALNPGTNGQVLTADSTTTEGLKWTTPLKASDINTNPLGLARRIVNVVANAGWTAAATDAPGKYQYIIPLAQSGSTTLSPNVFVQILMQTGSNYTIVNTSIDITSTQIIIYSNITFTGKILLLSIGGTF